MTAKEILQIDTERLQFKDFARFVFCRPKFSAIRLSEDCLERISQCYRHLLALIESDVPIYGVTTGFGDSCHRLIEKNQTEQLQRNLVNYLSCGTGETLSPYVARGLILARLQSLSRGYSGVSTDLIHQLSTLLEEDLLPSVPCEGSLGASGDLVPLAYLAQLVQGNGELIDQNETKNASETFQARGLSSYQLKAKEGLALVNGTSAMLAQASENLTFAKYLVQLEEVATSWLVLALEGKTEAFEELVNRDCKSFAGQSQAAFEILSLLRDENYTSKPASKTRINGATTEGYIQDRYSLRCTPQILGPIYDTIDKLETWLEAELNSVSDNPLINPENGELAMGGNFYGGYLAHGMDYLKISLANLADLIDRQLTYLIDDKSNRGLPPNLAAWNLLPESERHLHHGLKGLHQTVNALSAETVALASPHSVLSRSSESHNQDKVSLGMSAAMGAKQMIDKLFSITTINFICLAQALDLKEIKVRGKQSQDIFQLIRSHVPFAKIDTAFGQSVASLKSELRERVEDYVEQDYSS